MSHVMVDGQPTITLVEFDHKIIDFFAELDWPSEWLVQFNRVTRPLEQAENLQLIYMHRPTDVRCDFVVPISMWFQMQHEDRLAFFYGMMARAYAMMLYQKHGTRAEKRPYRSTLVPHQFGMS